MTPEPEAEDRATKPRRWPWIAGIVAALLFGFGIGAAGSETEPVAAEPEVITETVEVEKIVEPADVKESRERWQELATEQNTREDELDEREAELDEREAELAETEEAEPEPTVVEESDDGTAAQQNALRSAEQYLDYTSFSRSGLIEQLEYEGFSTEQAEYGVNQTGL